MRASGAMVLTEVPPATVPTVKVVLGSVGVWMSAILAMARPMPWMALGKEEFAAQPWAQGMLFLQNVESRPQLGLYEANVLGHQTPPLGILWRPELTACFNDSISFAGFEKVDKRWCYQVWYCETGVSTAE